MLHSKERASKSATTGLALVACAGLLVLPSTISQIACVPRAPLTYKTITENNRSARQLIAEVSLQPVESSVAKGRIVEAAMCGAATVREGYRGSNLRTRTTVHEDEPQPCDVKPVGAVTASLHGPFFSSPVDVSTNDDGEFEIDLRKIEGFSFFIANTTKIMMERDGVKIGELTVGEWAQEPRKRIESCTSAESCMQIDFPADDPAYDRVRLALQGKST